MALQVWLHGKDLINNGLCPNNATWVGPATYADGKLGKCYSCTKSHYISYTYDFASTNKFTIAFWIYIPTSLSTCNQWERVFYFQNYVIDWADYNNLKIYDNSSNQLWWLNGNNFYDKWVHLTIAHNADTITLYINGDHYATVASTSSPISSGIMYAGDGITDEHGPVKFNDIRLYDHCLSPKEVKEISKGLVLHYPLNDAYVEGTVNLGNTSASYSNMTDGREFAAVSWGGDAGTVTYYKSGGYNNLPYKVYHKTASGSGGIYSKTANDISIVAGKTYTMSVWVKASRNFLGDSYSFNINGVTSSDNNHYITYSKQFPFTTEWTRISRTFTATESDAGMYGEMSIIYDNWDTDYYIYFSGFQIEEKDHATPYTPNTRNETTVYDCSGYQNNGTISESLSYVLNSPRYKGCYYFNSPSKRITLPTINMSGFANTFSISWWGKVPSYPGIMYWGFNNGNHLNYFGGQYCNTSDGYNNPYYKPNTTTTISIPSENTWHFFIMVGDGSNNKLYMDGELYGVAKTYKGITGNTIIINGWDSSTNYKTNGYISDFRIYATALSADDIKELYNTSAYVLDNGTLLTYSVEE